MKVDVYQTKQKTTFLFLPESESFSSLPQAVLDQFGTLQFWKTVELAPTIIAVNPDAVEADFQKQGFSVQRIEIKVTEP